MQIIQNTFGIKVKTDSYIEYSNLEELKSSIKIAKLPFLHIGSASNLLFTKDFEGTIFHCSNKQIEILSQNDKTICLRVGAGCIWDKFVSYCVNHAWYGIENLSLIPGEVGAAAVQNIGAYGVEVKDVITRVNTFDIEKLSLVSFSNEECDYSYRHSIFKNPEAKKYFVYSVEFTLSKEPSFKLEYGNLASALVHPTIAGVREAIIDIRRKKLPDPEQVGNAGSFFMNPIVSESQFLELQAKYTDIPYYPAPDGKIKLSAGWLIEQCGWKGKSLGKAAIYHKQALIIVNLGDADGSDILSLANAVISSVREKFDITLKMEVQVV